MNALVAVAIAPFGEGEELSEYVAEVIRVIPRFGTPLAYQFDVYRDRR